ncbi:hypothetical protein K493DRAFT_300791 [Basidiobolus meristosporus CBS 931.73]|uniref:Uncharacterized protein n=1 Tax=Basidiobolus meristosporus CBS 931.73 TaxID=1314790 RepID=A0A1Y1YFB5_9FUNG|nr:hypothetical protein K493DRAFT_300791 [Basidiobolus meristosporus CBS 931.73]|eukprot:ORX96702.1 hypothetical protein K493DRAFT_300791 [Basidiobolus meristosporus CBS 931.73]
MSQTIFGKKFVKKLPYIDNRGIVIQHSGNRMYSRFDNLNAFQHWYLNLKPTQRLFAKIIGSGPQKFRLDLDGDISDPHILIQDVQNFFHIMGHGTPQILFYNISSSEKISYHLIVSSHYFSDNISCKIFTNSLIQYSQNSPWTLCVDTGVCKSVQGFRLEGSTKWQQKRWKYLFGTQQINPKSFPDSLLGNINTQTMRHISIPQSQLHQYFISHPPLPKPSSNTPPSSIPAGFKVRQILDSGLVTLNRIKPTYCGLCERIHEHENAYMIGDKFVCFRYASTN